MAGGLTPGSGGVSKPSADDRIGSDASRLDVTLTEDDVRCLAGVVAELSIAVNETKVVEQDVNRRDRLEQARYLVDRWQEVLRLRRELARAEEGVRSVR